MRTWSRCPLFPENRKSIPILFNGKNLLKNVNLHIVNFIPVSQLIKRFPIWYNVKFSSRFCIVYGSENRLKINITPHGIFFIII